MQAYNATPRGVAVLIRLRTDGSVGDRDVS